MSNIDGIKAEDFFEDFCIKNNLDVNRVHQPFDFLVNGKLVEVKSAKLYTNQTKSGDRINGRYQCWRKSQMDKLKRLNPWVCFIITNDNGFLIQGFTKAKNIPGTLKIPMKKVDSIKLNSAKEFLRYIN